MSDEALQEFLRKKKTTKKSLCEKLAFDHKMPLIGIVIDNELAKAEEEMVAKLLEGVSALDVEIVVLADTNLNSFTFANVHHVPYCEKQRRTLLEAADMMIALPHNDVDEWLLNGVVPVSHLRPEVADYDPNHETGNSFVYGEYDKASHYNIFAALVRALETFKFPYDWKHIVSMGVEGVKGA